MSGSYEECSKELLLHNATPATLVCNNTYLINIYT